MPILLADARNGALGFAVDDHDVYWTEIYGGTISRCAIGGCGNRPTLLFGQLASPVAIGLDAGYVYWTEEGTFSYGIDTRPDSVERMAKYVDTRSPR